MPSCSTHGQDIGDFLAINQGRQGSVKKSFEAINIKHKVIKRVFPDRMIDRIGMFGMRFAYWKCIMLSS